MKQILKRAVAVMTASVLAVGMLTGCGGKGGSSKADADTLVITVAKLGFGDQWLTELAKAYEEKTGQKVQVISKVGESGLSAIKGELQSQSSETDIFFTRPSEFFKSIYRGAVTINGEKYDCEFADLTDVWESTPEGDDKSIKEKMNADFEAYYNVDGKYYGLPWADSVMGFVRNKNVWDKLKLTEEDVPRTTDEMFALADKVKAKGTAPFIYSLESEYYSSIAPIWFAQYEGSENMAYFNAGLDPIGEKSYNLYAYDGQVKALEIVERLVNKENGYHHATSESSSFTDMQSTFLLDQALFCVNGSWLEVEMGENYKDSNIDFIKTPLISDIIEKLDTVKDDKTLSEVVAYVDGDASKAPAGVSKEDVEVVRDARKASYMRGGFDHTALVPAYSNQLDAAKDFLKFMYSDEGMNVYYKATSGSQLPLTPSKAYDDSVKVSAFRQNINALTKEGNFCVYGQGKAKIFAIGGVSCYWYNGSNNFVRALLDGKTPDEICVTNNEYLKANWSSMSNY